MTQVTADEAPAGGKVPSPYTERLVTHVRPDVKERLTMQAALQGRVPAHLADEVLGEGLMTFDQIADAMRQRGSAGRSNGDGTH